MADGVAGSTIIPLSEFSDLQLERLQYVAPLPCVLRVPTAVAIVRGDVTAARSSTDLAALRSWFPCTYGQPLVNFAAGDVAAPSPKIRVGVLFCGRQAPGGLNVVAALADALTALNPENMVVGFVGGTKGLFERKALVLTNDLLISFRNQGGYHLLGRSVDRIRSIKEQQLALESATELGLAGLVLIGGTFTNTDAAHLAEYFAANQDTAAAVRTCVIGVPVSIDGDLRNQFVETTVGHDTATKVYSQLVGNMATDANSAKKYTYFVRLMGRAHGHIALEVALQTHPNVTLVGEDIETRKLTLTDVVRELSDVVAARAAAGKNFGVVLVPEGIVNSIPEIRTLIAEMNTLFSEGEEPEGVPAKLTPWSRAVLSYLPLLIRQQLFLERESNGAVQLSQISTERMLAELVGAELERRRAAGTFCGKYASITHFFGYQARSSLPSNFDCALGDALGRTAASLVAGGCNGYMATVRNLNQEVAAWQPTGVPLTAMLSTPTPGSATHSYGGGSIGKDVVSVSGGGVAKIGVRPVIASAPVDVDGPAFSALARLSAAWRMSEVYANPGPIQFDGSTADDTTITLGLERHDYVDRIDALRAQLDAIRTMCRPGVSESVLDAALTGVTSLSHILAVIKKKE